MTCLVAEPRVCDFDGCEAPPKAKGLCHCHYTRLRRHGDPTIVLPFANNEGDDNLPNPWAKVSPTCPLCGSPEWVFLWTDEGDLRWFCQPCRRRFTDVNLAPASTSSPSTSSGAPAGPGGGVDGAAQVTPVEPPSAAGASRVAPHRENNQPAAIKATGRSETAAVPAESGR